MVVKCDKNKLSNDPNALSKCYWKGVKIGFQGGIKKGVNEGRYQQAKKGVNIQKIKKLNVKPLTNYKHEELRTLARDYNKKYPENKITNINRYNHNDLKTLLTNKNNIKKVMKLK